MYGEVNMTTYFYHIREKCRYQYVRVVLSDDTSMAVAADSCNRMFPRIVIFGLNGLAIIWFVSLLTQTTLVRGVVLLSSGDFRREAETIRPVRCQLWNLVRA